jgi:hypothetical protein
MPKRSSKQKDTQQLARSVLDAIAPDAEPAVKPAPNKAKPPRPTKRADVEDIDRADSEGMAQPQGTPPPEKNPAAVALGRLGGLKGGKARAEKLTPAKRKQIAKKAAAQRWGNKASREIGGG